MKFITPLFITTVLITFSCTNVQEAPPVPYRSNNDSVVRDIPEWYRNSGFAKRYHKELLGKLKLRSLENGHDSLNIRILIDCGYNTSSLIMLERTQSELNAVFLFIYNTKIR